MAITEFVFVPIKKDPALIEEMEKGWREKAAALFDPNPGVLVAFRGWVISENGVDIRSENLEVLMFEWIDLDTAKAFMQSDQYMKFLGSVKPNAAAPAKQQFLNTTGGFKEIGTAAIPEIVQVNVGNDEEAATAEKVWGKISAIVGESGKVMYGKTLNVDQAVFSGSIGWSSSETRQRIVGGPDYQAAISELQKLGEVKHSIAELDQVDIKSLQ